MKIKFLLLLFILIATTICAKNNFVIIIPSYNNSAWVKKNLDSVFEQTYKNFRVIYIDDISTDGTGKLVENYVKQNGLQKKLKLIKNQKKMLALGNTYYAVHSCNPSEIVVILDGDDWFDNKDVLSCLNETYNDKNIWMTFGSFRYFPSNRVCERPRLNSNMTLRNKVREDAEHVWYHVRSFYAGLFQKIKKEDLLFEGKFFEMSGDGAYMIPMFEMAGQHYRFIDKVLYIYNQSGYNHDWAKNYELANKLAAIIRGRQSYEKLNRLF